MDTPNTPKDPCPDCKGTGLVNRKAWTAGPPHRGIHPAILAARPAYRTIVSVPCPRGCKPPKK